MARLPRTAAPTSRTRGEDDRADLFVPLSQAERELLEHGSSSAAVGDRPSLEDWAREVLLRVAVAGTARTRRKVLTRAVDLRSLIASAERTLIRLALARTGGNQTHAAALLRIGRRNLIGRMEKLGLKPRPSEPAFSKLT